MLLCKTNYHCWQFCVAAWRHESPFYKRGFTLFPVWIGNYIHYQVWDAITYLKCGEWISEISRVFTRVFCAVYQNISYKTAIFTKLNITIDNMMVLLCMYASIASVSIHDSRLEKLFIYKFLVLNADDFCSEHKCRLHIYICHSSALKWPRRM